MTYNVLFAHPVLTGVHPSTVTARTPGTREISTSTRSRRDGARQGGYSTSDGRSQKVRSRAGSNPNGDARRRR